MKDYKVFASLSYFSIFFAGFIFPLAVYFIVQDDEVKYHAKRAFISHIIPFFTIILFILGIFSGSISSIISAGLLFIIINLIILIWNIVQGIKILL
ncbi:hypothetical protein BHF71_01800 [Vulcanibacillus modesticaldus]|uniref:DUF4870 domain-containing protein n=1 Tax=Vulcanibacillus modesticaldus TaxID=337097 RepID=A0A1D2YUI5_9BACI|nr:DUF4870 domain-containing protein [Vulcanibacillus modesticaldus]OEF99347.1 hypothetical protein BHF71_01800 [Vulcanibacillus modesticaldus]